MRTIEKKHQRVLAAILIGLLAMPCGLQAQNANKQVWWLKTDKGQYIEMSRVKKLANVNEKEAFEVIAHQGQGASGVLNVTFEKNSLVVVNGDASGDGVVDSDDDVVLAGEGGFLHFVAHLSVSDDSYFHNDNFWGQYTSLLRSLRA